MSEQAESAVYYYSHPRGGSGTLYGIYPAGPDLPCIFEAKAAASAVARAEILAYYISKDGGIGFRFGINPRSHRLDPEKLPEPQEFMPPENENEYGGLRREVEAAVGRTGLAIVITSGPRPF